MFNLGMTELLVIFVIALLVFGPKRLPDLARSLGRAIGEFRRASTDLRRQLLEPQPEPSISKPPAAEPPDSGTGEPAKAAGARAPTAPEPPAATASADGAECAPEAPASGPDEPARG